MNGDNVIYFDSFGVERIPDENKKLMHRKFIITKIFRVQAYDSILYGYFCIGFFNFILKGYK